MVAIPSDIRSFAPTNNSLIKTSSLADPIIANQRGRVPLASTFTDMTLVNVRVEKAFTGPDIMLPILEPTLVDLAVGSNLSGALENY